MDKVTLSAPEQKRCELAPVRCGCLAGAGAWPVRSWWPAGAKPIRYRCRPGRWWP